MTVLMTTDGHKDLPRYFSQVFEMAQRIPHGRLDIVLPDGRRFRAEGAEPGPIAELQVKNPDLFARLLREGDLGFSEAYLDGWWTTPDLQSFMDLVHEATDTMLDGYPAAGIVRIWEKLRFWFASNTKKGAKKNIAYHYDLGNDFYALWLDDTMTYSSALFQTGQESLEAAQTAKYSALLDQLGVKPGDHVLEIGCGWGGFAEYAAKERDLRVTGLTISEAQYDFARDRMQTAGVEDQVTIRLQDYRDETGRYDGIASIEMFEAVGERYWPVYFDKVKSCLKDGGRASLQIITVEDKRFKTYRKQVDFIQKYIFPGGMLPSPGVLKEEAARAGLRLCGSNEFGNSYSQTLTRWHDTFNDRWDQITLLGFDDRFRRMWNYYLTSCAAAFRTGVCDVTQFTLAAPAR